MTTLTATLSITMIILTASQFLSGSAETSETVLEKVDTLQECLQPTYVSVTHEPTEKSRRSSPNAVNGPHRPFKVKREIESNMYPSPRIGRAMPHSMNPGYTGIKRFGNGLIPFPRIGRSGSGPKRNGAGGGSLWFGPRLGKRNYQYVVDPALFDAMEYYANLDRQSATPSADGQEFANLDWAI